MEDLENTVDLVIASLKSNRPILVNVQIPDEYSQYDVLFAYNFNNYGSHQRGIVPSDLLIGVIGFGCFGFRTDIYESAQGYYSEKLHVDSEALTIFFNKVRRRLSDDLQSI